MKERNINRVVERLRLMQSVPYDGEPMGPDDRRSKRRPEPPVTEAMIRRCRFDSNLSHFEPPHYGLQVNAAYGLVADVRGLFLLFACADGNVRGPGWPRDGEKLVTKWTGLDRDLWWELSHAFYGMKSSEAANVLEHGAMLYAKGKPRKYVIEETEACRWQYKCARIERLSNG